MAHYHLEKMSFFAWHGVYPEEKTTGNNFIVNLEYDFASEAAELSDQLNDTLDYSALARIIGEEMKTRSDLLEHLARRILDRLKQYAPDMTNIRLKITKCNPPAGVKMDGVTVELRG